MPVPSGYTPMGYTLLPRMAQILAVAPVENVCRYHASTSPALVAEL